MKTKVCTKCKIKKPRNKFHKAIASKDGFNTRCKECRNKDKKKEYIKNKDKYILRAKIWAEENRERSNEIKYNYKIKKLKVDPVYRMVENLRKRIRSVLKEINKSKTSMELLGCSAEKFKNHLEKQFTKGMTWENYGYYGWHIDHIKPCASFDLSDPKQQRKCFHYTNLQPLWAKDNYAKKDKY